MRKVRLKELVKVNGGQDQKLVEKESGEFLIYGSGGPIGRAHSFLYNKSSVLLGRKGTIDKPIYVNEPFWSVDTMFFTTPKTNIDMKYFYYLTKTIDFNLYKNGSTVPSMTSSTLNKIIFDYEKDIINQIKIVNFLDKKTSLIDKKISLLEKKIELYEEYKQLTIDGFIMSESKNSKIVKFKSDFNVYTGNSIGEKHLFENKEDARPYISTKDIEAKTNIVDYDNGMYIPLLNKDFRIANKEDSLLCIEGGSAGKKIAFLNQKASFVNKLACFSVKEKNKNFGKYAYYYLQSSYFKNQFFNCISGLIGGVSINLIKNFKYIRIEFEKQQAIVKKIEFKIERVDKLIELTRKEIELQKEYKKTLINDVVTGKIEV